jgi:DNA-binding GntR family transcriptional regulator
MEQSNNDAIDRRPLHREVTDRLRALIVQGELAPGERLNERVLAERFNISRTPLREAIKLLSLEGLVRLLPNRGAEVTRLTPSDVEDLFQVMGALEALAGELACARATDEDIAEIRSMHERMFEHFKSGDRAQYFSLNQRIHRKIVECARNEELSAMYGNLTHRVYRARYMANFSTTRWGQAMEEHDEILAALSQRDSRRLNAILKAHLANKLDVIKLWLAESENGGDEDGEVAELAETAESGSTG